MRFIKGFTVPGLVVLSSLVLAACSDSGSSVPTGAPGANSPVSTVTLTNATTQAAFLPGASLPAPGADVPSPRIIGITSSVRPSGPMLVNLLRVSTVNDILVGLPGSQGYFDLNVRGVTLSTTTYGATAYPVTINLTTGLPSLIPLSIQTVSGGVASAVTTLNVRTTVGNEFNPLECGGGSVAVNFTQVVNTNADTSPATFGLSGANYVSNLQNNSQLQNTTAISAQPCSNDPGDPDLHRTVVISIPGQPIAGHTYTLSYLGSSRGDGSLEFSDGGLLWTGSGMLTVQGVSAQVLTFTVHASMFPVPQEAGPSPARGSFTIDLGGTVGITGL